MWLCLLRPTGWNDPTYRWGSCWPNNLHWLEAVNGWWLSVIVLCTVHLEWTLTLQRYLGNIDFLPSHSFFIYLFFPALLPFLSRWWWSVPAPAASLDYLSHLRRPQDTSGGGGLPEREEAAGYWWGKTKMVLQELSCCTWICWRRVSEFRTMLYNSGDPLKVELHSCNQYWLFWILVLLSLVNR